MYLAAHRVGIEQILNGVKSAHYDLTTEFTSVFTVLVC